MQRRFLAQSFIDLRFGIGIVNAVATQRDGFVGLGGQLVDDGIGKVLVTPSAAAISCKVSIAPGAPAISAVIAACTKAVLASCRLLLPTTAVGALRVPVSTGLSAALFLQQVIDLRFGVSVLDSVIGQCLGVAALDHHAAFVDQHLGVTAGACASAAALQ